MKKLIYILIVVCLVMFIGCSDNSEQRMVEEYAVRLVRGRTFTHNSVVETIFDEESGDYIIYVAPDFPDSMPFPDGSDTMRVVLRIQENGDIYWVNFREGLNLGP